VGPAAGVDQHDTDDDRQDPAAVRQVETGGRRSVMAMTTTVDVPTPARIA
jgi:hypothetical protein